MIVLLRLILFAVCWLAAATALAEKRVALVIGNSAYRHAPALPNPKNDAEAMAASLSRLNFEVFAGTDLDKSAMERLMRRFSDAAEKADVAVAFYAGHGLQVHGRNYLVPVDAKLDKEIDLRFDAVPLDDVQSLMEMGSRINILILDACRDNPLARNLARNMGTRSTAIGRGLGETKAGIGTLIVYATQPGNVALDGDDKNSPFTAALLKYIEAPGLEIRQVLTRVRNDVINSTRDKQVPWDSSSLRGDFYFAGTPAQPATPPSTNLVQPPTQVQPPPALPVPAPPSPDNEALFWQTIKDSRNVADFRAYLARYPNGTFSELAKIRIADLEKPAVVTPPPPERSVTPPPAPAPAPPRRVSTFERNTFISGDTLVSAKIVANVQACAASCVVNRQCVSWIFLHSTSGCIIHNKMHGKSANPDWTSGVIRVVRDTQPGTTPAAPTAPPAPPPARTVAPQQDLVREVMRMAQAGEAENGFCARTGWPIYRSAQQAAGPHEREQVGTTRVFQHLYGTQGCGFGRTVSVAFENGRRCVRNAWWQCLVGAKCNYAIYKFCKSDQGTYDYVPGG